MKLDITDLQCNKELDKQTLVATRGGLAPLAIETTTSAVKSPTAGAGCTGGTVSVCHIDGTDDGDSIGLHLA
jgi:hypothetical protein